MRVDEYLSSSSQSCKTLKILSSFSVSSTELCAGADDPTISQPGFQPPISGMLEIVFFPDVPLSIPLPCCFFPSILRNPFARPTRFLNWISCGWVFGAYYLGRELPSLPVEVDPFPIMPISSKRLSGYAFCLVRDISLPCAALRELYVSIPSLLRS